MPVLIKLCISNLLLVKQKLYFFVFPLDYCILDDEDRNNKYFKNKNNLLSFFTC